MHRRVAASRCARSVCSWGERLRSGDRRGGTHLRRLAATLCLVSFLGCVAKPPPALEPVTDLYGRNEIVAIPSIVGGYLGWWISILDGFPLATVGLILTLGNDEVAVKIMNYNSTAHAYLFAGVFGTPFLPFSFLAPANEKAKPAAMQPAGDEAPLEGEGSPGDGS